MAIGGAFLGGGVELVPAGSCKLELEILTEDRANLTATFTIKGTSTYTVTAGADGRAVYTVPAGQTYTVSVNTTGYDNIASQTVIAESGTVRYVRFEAFSGRVKRSGDTMTGTLAVVGGASIDTNGQVIGKKLRATADIHLGSSPSSYAVINDGWIQNRTIDETKADLGVTGKQDKLTAGTNITISGTTISAKDTTYDVATQSANGLMSSADKTKLDGVDSALAGKVSKSGDTMTGSLTTQMSLPQMYFTNTTDDFTVPATAVDTTHYLAYLDKNGQDTFHISEYKFVGGRGAAITLRNKTTNEVKEANLGITVEDSGSIYLTAPSWSVGTNDNSDKVMTIKMANSLPSLVHTTGNETIAGDKIFSSVIHFNNSLRIKPIASTTRRAVVFNKVVDGSEMGWIGYPSDTGDMVINLISGDRVNINKPTPSDATGTEIVTANWANSKFQRKITYGTGDPPSGGQAGDIYIQI